MQFGGSRRRRRWGWVEIDTVHLLHDYERAASFPAAAVFYGPAAAVFYFSALTELAALLIHTAQTTAHTETRVSASYYLGFDPLLAQPGHEATNKNNSSDKYKSGLRLNPKSALSPSQTSFRTKPKLSPRPKPKPYSEPNPN